MRSQAKLAPKARNGTCKPETLDGWVLKRTSYSLDAWNADLDHPKSTSKHLTSIDMPKQTG